MTPNCAVMKTYKFVNAIEEFTFMVTNPKDTYIDNIRDWIFLAK